MMAETSITQLDDVVKSIFFVYLSTCDSAHDSAMPDVCLPRAVN